MSLSPEDVQAIGAMFDEKLGRVQAAERRRRRLWFWFWMALFIGSSVASWFAVKRLMSEAQERLAKADDEMRDAKLNYQAELKRSAAMQAERKAAEEASRYVSKQDQGTYEAGLLQQVFKIQMKAVAFNKALTEMADGPMSTPAGAAGDQVERDRTEDLQGIMAEGMGVTNDFTKILMQIMLRNTDPAHNTAEDKLVGSELEGAAPPAGDAPAATLAPEPTLSVPVVQPAPAP
jgi:hypothetical protein